MTRLGGRSTLAPGDGPPGAYDSSLCTDGKQARVVAGVMAAVGVSLSLSYVSYQQLKRLGDAQRLVDETEGSRRSRDHGENRNWVGLLNEVTLDLNRDLGQPAFVPRACARILFAFGALIAVVGACVSLQALGSSTAWQSGVVGFGVTAVGALGCLSIGRVAERKAGKIREQWNTLIRQSSQDVPTQCRGRRCEPAAEYVS